ncbi:hypothetical protein ASE74_21125 [Pedobacter sp. Leaf216]|uniref:hypothetical protein n=1 Tax=Pedobacter sp. Leaf216 TaxID=1735684 RepID=UPI00070230F9|nr:hypothetical protein [Pedobacter sp. Leaf216]KQM73016.1 hypothetical protein ASE74_21125 [Pedobacter sp. Leaf216]
MHPYIEIIFSLFLAITGKLMIRKLNALKRSKASHLKKSYTAHKHVNLLTRKISFRFKVILFTLVIIVAFSILIEKGIVIVTW